MKRSKHSLSHYKLLTCDMGKLIPVACVPVLPGDTFQHQTSALIRVSPLVAPVMHPVTVRIHHWFVPNRIVNPNWEDFITGGADGNDASPIPTIPSQATVGNNLDYLGIPPIDGIDVNSMPVQAYNKIINDWYADQDIIGLRNLTDRTVANCAWEKDYFTTARPWTQKGDEVTLPISGIAQVESTGPMTFTGNRRLNTNGESPNKYIAGNEGAVTDLQYLSGLQANLATTEQIPINDFRMGFALQRYKEARARYGSRYTEYLAYLGVKSSDSRLQRAEYLGGGKQTIAFSEVLGTYDGGAGGGTLGQMGGHGIAALRSNRYRKFFEEHGYVITLMSVRPKTIYSDGIHREYLKQTKEDYYQRELEHVGHQGIYNNELYAVPDSDTSGYDTFGYNDRYAEYRSHPSGIAGEFRSTLNYWHMARQFGTAPALNPDFIKCDATKRIHAEQTQHSLWCMVNHKIVARRIVKKPQQYRVL